MKYCGKNQDPSKIIKSFTNEGNNYHIIYADESETVFYCSDKDKYDKLIQEMIKQAKDRENEESIQSLEIKLFLLRITSIICMGGSLKAYQMNAIFLSALLFILGMFLIKEKRIEANYLKDIKKYKIYLEMVKEDNLKIEDISEHDHFYREDITINSLDDKSLSTLKYVKKYKNKNN